MKQKSIALTEAQWTWLSKRAAKLGITMSDVIRRIVDQLMEDKK